MVVLIAVTYAVLVFAIAWLGDRARHAPRVAAIAGWTYPLALMVYCTSWTFYGAVGTAVSEGWTYLPIYLGPAFVFLFAPGLIRRLVRIGASQNIATLSDFIAARYGRSRLLAALVTILLTAGALPYIALQLQSVEMSFSALTRGSADFAAPIERGGGASFLTAIALAAFAIAFGTREPDANRGNPGLMLALALESVVKLVALVAVAAFALFLIGAGGATPVEGGGASAAVSAQATQIVTARLTPGPPSLHFVTLTILSMAAIICLPRQFHVLVAEAPKEGLDRALARARWLVPAYLAATSIVVLPIALAGSGVLAEEAPGDLFVLALPLALDQPALALLVFVGGIAAATGMIIVSTIALSTMITHDLILPALLRLAGRSVGVVPVLIVRRVVIAALLGAASLYLSVSGGGALAQIGLIAFVAAAQLAPALVAAVSWRGGRRDGALAGVMAGGLVWAYTLLLPALAGREAIEAWGLTSVLGGALDPHALFGVTAPDPITHAALWSLSLNALLFVAVSLNTPERLIDRVQASAFVREEDEDRDSLGERRPDGRAARVTVGALRSLAERFYGPEAVSRAFERFGHDLGLALKSGDQADWRLVQRTERLLAGAVGSSTARIVLASAMTNSTVAFGDMLAVLDETRADRRFKRHLLQATLENLRQGVSVVDKDLRLVAWNGAYLSLFNFRPGLVHVGRPIEDVIRDAAARGELGPGDVETQVARRLAFLRAGGAHDYERTNADGRVLRIEGNPMPGGGYVTTYTDITAERAAEAALRHAKEGLEQRVLERTAELAAMAEERDEARRRAEASEATKTRFLAAASHDLQQPLNAARLFAGALKEEASADPGAQSIVDNIDRSIRSADRMLRGLLDLSKFDADGVRPAIGAVSVAELFEELAHAHQPIARSYGLSLRLRPIDAWILTDRDLVRSILQNLLSNALRYTQAGGVLLAARGGGRGERISLEVWDTGPGVPEAARERIFEEFRRLHDADRGGERGAGLGLAIAARAATILGAKITLVSRLGRGSVFRVALPRAGTPDAPAVAPERPAPLGVVDHRLRVLCLDDEPSVQAGMSALLSRWGCDVVCVSDTRSARAEALNAARAGAGFDAVLVDFHLGGAETGDAVLRTLVEDGAAPPRRAILTADTGPHVEAAARACGAELIAKPVDPVRLRAFLSDDRGQPALS